ncbi:MAG TPA: carboxymuconolactone decarboxylase family protein [Acidimicrobiales bacterium]
MPEEPTAVQKMLGDFAPKLVSLTDEVVFGDIWERPGLSKRDRSLITVSALVSLYRTEQMESHMRRAIDNGVTLDELIEAITHLAFYAGWPNAITAMTLARRLFEQ